MVFYLDSSICTIIKCYYMVISVILTCMCIIMKPKLSIVYACFTCNQVIAEKIDYPVALHNNSWLIFIPSCIIFPFKKTFLEHFVELIKCKFSFSHILKHVTTYFSCCCGCLLHMLGPIPRPKASGNLSDGCP